MKNNIQFQDYFDDKIKIGDLILWLDGDKWIVTEFKKQNDIFVLYYFCLKTNIVSHMYVNDTSKNTTYPFQKFRVIR